MEATEAFFGQAPMSLSLLFDVDFSLSCDVLSRHDGRSIFCGRIPGAVKDWILVTPENDLVEGNFAWRQDRNGSPW
jgi:hypothetical protein